MALVFRKDRETVEYLADFDSKPSFVNLLKEKKRIVNQVEGVELKCKELSENRIEEVQRLRSLFLLLLKNRL